MYNYIRQIDTLTVEGETLACIPVGHHDFATYVDFENKKTFCFKISKESAVDSRRGMLEIQLIGEGGRFAYIEIPVYGGAPVGWYTVRSSPKHTRVNSVSCKTKTEEPHSYYYKIEVSGNVSLYTKLWLPDAIIEKSDSLPSSGTLTTLNRLSTKELLSSGVDYVDSDEKLPAPGIPGRICYVKVPDTTTTS